MASLLNNASLLFNPAGSVISYEQGKILSVLPTNGDGDFTFTGGDGGTRVNQQGYIEPTPFNMFTYSNDLSNGIYTFAIGGGSLGGIVAGPTPEIYGRTVNLNTDGYFYNQAINGPYFNTFSTIICSVWMRVTSGTLSLQIGNPYGAPYETKTLTTTWQRFNIIYDNTVPSLGLGIYNNITGVSISIEVAGFQANLGTVVKDYQPTTNRLNYPRITYQNGRGAILNELQSTNLNLYSQGFDNAYWNKQNASITASAGISPDGTNNAFKLNANATTNMHIIFTSGWVGTFNGFVATSVFAKKGEYDYLLIRIDEPASTITYFNLANGTVGAVGSGHTAYIEPYKDGWYRCTTVFNKNIYNYCLGVTNANNSTSPILEADKGIYIWGSQLETGTFTLNRATSYIPTKSATVTRVRDRPDVSGISSLVGQSSGGTIYISGTPRGGDHEFIALTPGGYNTTNIVVIYYNVGNLRLNITGGGTTIIGGNALAIPIGQYFKAAVRYQNGSTAYYVNGQQVVTTSSALTFSSTLNRLDINSANYYFATPGAQEISTVATYPTGLTNDQLEELTTVRSGSGGTISYYGPYTIHTFTSSTTFTPSFNGQVEVLVVAGGASGGVGSNGGGGGGAGGLLYVSSYGVAQGTGVTVTVGAGGGSRIGRGSGNNGSDSVFGGLTSIGGGGGGGATNGPAFGKDGGSAGGAQYSSAGGNGIPGQGNNGGDGNYYLGGNHDAGGGGGGAGFAGLDATLSNAGNGGDGLPYSISGFSTYYAGGGGGSSNKCLVTRSHYPGEGGLGGGGKGGIQGTTLLGTDGVDGLGAGGGAGVGSAGGYSGAGGDGIVIVRYLT